MNTQNPNNVFVFDMDNTLIKTDKANNLAYSEAIRSVLSVNCNIENGKRFTRNELKDLFPQLTQTQIDEIIDRKEKSFESYLNETELNNNLFSILKCLHQEGHHTILLTNCHSGRAISLCNFYDLTKYFVRRFFTKIVLATNTLFLNLWDMTYKMSFYMKTKRFLPQKQLLTESI